MSWIVKQVLRNILQKIWRQTS